MGDAAYDSDALRSAIAAKGAEAVIPNNPSRAIKYPLNKPLYAERHLIECCFSKLKRFRRVATRYEKTARNYMRSRPPGPERDLPRRNNLDPSARTASDLQNRNNLSQTLRS